MSLIPSKLSERKAKMSQPMHNTIVATEALPSAPQPTSPPHDAMMLSPGELSIIFQTGDFTQQIALAFNDNPTASMMLQHFCFMSFSIQQLEFNVERH